MSAILMLGKESIKGSETIYNDASTVSFFNRHH